MIKIIVRKKRLYLTKHDCGLHSHRFIVGFNELSLVDSFHSKILPSIIIVLLSCEPLQRHS